MILGLDWMIHLFRFDPEMLDDDEYEALTEGDRQAAEALMRARDRAEGRGEGRLRRGLLYEDEDEDEGPQRGKRRRAAEMAAMAVGRPLIGTFDLSFKMLQMTSYVNYRLKTHNLFFLLSLMVRIY